MGVRPLLFNILSVLCVISYSYAAQAQQIAYDPNIALKGRYEFSFSGIPLGKMGIEIAQTPTHYDGTCDITLTGLISMFVQHSSHTTVAASNGSVHYDTHYHTRKKARSVTLDYKGGALVAKQIVPPEAAEKRPPIPDALMQNAADPLTFLLNMHAGMRDALMKGKTQFTLKTYDGRRLNEVTFLIKGPKTISYLGEDTQTISVAITRKALGGFTAQEMQDLEGGEPVLYAYFTNDERLIPIRFEARKFGTLSATLVRECAAGESCLLGITQ